MALNSSGPISLVGCCTGVSIRKELGLSGALGMTCTSVRGLAGVASGAIVMPTNFYGKSNGISVSYLLVASGGGGGTTCNTKLYAAGGGGAGGVLSGTKTISCTTTYNVTIGIWGYGGNFLQSVLLASSGGNASIFCVTAYGGGAGGSVDGTCAQRNGSSGGSGGGGTGGGYAGGTGVSGQGYAGGAGAASGGAGGGGAGAAGATPTPNPQFGGAGGNGVTSSITGSSVYYGGGGGGGQYGCGGNGNHIGPGGLGGGGQGSVCGGASLCGTKYYFCNGPKNGTNLLGGGGGAGGKYKYGSLWSASGANGGGGVAYVSYAGSPKFSGGVITCVGGNTLHRFGTSGALVPFPGSYPSAGSQSYTTPGTYTWTAPAGVNNVSVVAIGSGSITSCCYNSGLGGGGLGFVNSLPVTPGNSYTVVVGAAASASIYRGSDSYFISRSTVLGGGAGVCYGNFSTSTQRIGRGGGTWFGDGGGNGGNGGFRGFVNLGCCGCGISGGGGGGAGGYSGNGGNGAHGPCSNGSSGYAGCSGSGGGGGGGGSAVNSLCYVYATGGGGGGTGLFGQGSNGAGGAGGFPSSGATNKRGFGGGGGSGGGAGTQGQYPYGGTYGGGGGGDPYGYYTNTGGAVRIVWPGNTRRFPSTCVGSP